MKAFIYCLLALCATYYGYSQTIELPETVININSDYTNSIKTENSCNYVKKLEEALLSYNHSELSNLYDSKKDIYKVTFKIPEGLIIASFNKDGKIIKTYETYKNIRLPLEVLQNIVEKYPNCSIVEDVYIVKFHCNKNALEQTYNVKLKNKYKEFTIKTNKKGKII